MFDIKQPQSDHLQQNPLPASTSRLWEHNSEILPTASSGQFDGGRDVSFVIGEGATENTPHDPHTTDMVSYGMTEYSSPPSYATVPYTYPPADVGFVDGIPEGQQVISPVNQGNDQLGHALRPEISGPTQAACSYPSAHHWHTPLGPPIDDLQQLASRYIRHPNSRVDAVCTERTSAGGCKVTITLEVTDFL